MSLEGKSGERTNRSVVLASKRKLVTVTPVISGLLSGGAKSQTVFLWGGMAGARTERLPAKTAPSRRLAWRRSPEVVTWRDGDKRLRERVYYFFSNTELGRLRGTVQ